MSDGQSAGAAGKYRLVQVFTLKENATRPADMARLRIGEYEIKLFRSVLRQQMELNEDSRGNWWLSFFRDSGRPQHLFVRFIDTDVAEASAWSRDKPAHCASRLTQVAYAQLAGKRSETDPDELQILCSDTSQMVRQSRSVKPDQLYEASTHYGHVSGRGAQFISKLTGHNDDQFRRHVLLYALAYAYLLTFEALGNDVSQALLRKSGQDVQALELRRLYREAAFFDAMSFFHQPVMRSNAPTCAAWNRIDGALGVTDSRTELLKQLESAHYICDLEARRAMESKETRRTFWLTVLGLVLALASGLGAVNTIREWFS